MMRDDSSGVLEAVQRLYAKSNRLLAFGDLLNTVSPHDDAALAELIEADGRQLLSRGESVNLNRYIKVVSDLKQRPDPLDAAIDVTLRSLAGSSRVTPQAVDELIRQSPELEEAIREAAMLNAAMWSTSGLRASVAPPPVKDLPCDFGPLMSSGAGGGNLRRYQLQRLLGQGAFGQVYLALDRQLSEEGHTALVAIKIIGNGRMGNMRQSPWARQRLIEEATKVRRISHPNVVNVIDRGVTEQDEDYIVYEYVDGGDLSEAAAGPMRLPVREAAALMAKIARGVHAAHSAGVIHCDLKPSNIMLTAAGEPKVVDFGIAERVENRTNQPDWKQSIGETADRASRSLLDSFHRPIGSLAFISPEQFRIEDGGLSIPSDVYALGGIFFLLLTGELPNGSTPSEIARTHDSARGRSEAPPVRRHRSEVDADLEAICRRAMAVNPHDRYSSAATFAEDLQHWLNREPIQWTRPSVWRVARLWARRKPALAASVVAIVMLVLGGSGSAVYLASVANLNRVRFEEEQKTRLVSRRIAQKVSDTLRPMSDYRFSTEALTKIWTLEYVYGPKVLGLEDEIAGLWKMRVANIRALVQRTRERGEGDHLETLLWESALGYWLVCAKDFQEAEPLLQANLEKWSRLLAPDDPWMADVRSMLTCAAVNRKAAEHRERAADEFESQELRELESALLAACDRLPSDHHGTPIHYMLLTILRDLYGPNLLHDLDQQKRCAQDLHRLTGVNPHQRN